MQTCLTTCVILSRVSGLVERTLSMLRLKCWQKPCTFCSLLLGLNSHSDRQITWGDRENPNTCLSRCDLTTCHGFHHILLLFCETYCNIILPKTHAVWAKLGCSGSHTHFTNFAFTGLYWGIQRKWRVGTTFRVGSDTSKLSEWVSVCVTLCTKWIYLLKALFLSSVFSMRSNQRDTLKFVGKKCCMFVCPSKGKNGCTKQSSVPVRKEEFTKCILTESLVLKHYIEISFEGTGRLKSLNQQINQNVNAVLVISSFQGPTNRMWKVFFLYPGNRKRTCTDICHHSATDS